MKNLISVIVPVYNSERYLERCVASICNQSHTELEIILVNDGSSDHSLEICNKLVLKDERIKLIDQKNGGSSIARNAGLDSATGDIIAFVDSDDHIKLELFETMLNLLVTHDLEVVEFERNAEDDSIGFDGTFKIENRAEATARTIRTTGFQCWKRIYKRSVIENLRFIPRIIHQDVFFTIDVLNRVDRIGFLNSPLYIYNRESIGIIRSKYSQMKRDIAIRATEYLRDNVIKDKDVQRAMDNYIVFYYTDHFYLLSRNSHLDKDKSYRKKLKSEIRRAMTKSNRNLRSLLALYSPLFCMELISSMGKKLKPS